MTLRSFNIHPFLQQMTICTKSYTVKKCRLSFLITFMGLIATAILNNHHYLANKYPRSDTGSGCKTGEENLFLGAAVWCVFTVGLGLISYALFSAGVGRDRSHQRDGYLANEQGNVAMGQTHDLVQAK